MLETKTATLAIQKMIKEKSEASRHASSISPDDLESLLVALRCVVIPVEDDIKDSLADTTEFAWQDNKYEPQPAGAIPGNLEERGERAKFTHITRLHDTVRSLLLEGVASYLCVCKVDIQCTRLLVFLRHHIDTCCLLTGPAAKPRILGVGGQRMTRGCSRPPCALAGLICHSLWVARRTSVWP